MSFYEDDDIDDPEWGTWQRDPFVLEHMKNVARKTVQGTQAFFNSYQLLIDHKDDFFTLAVEYGNFEVALATYNDGALVNGLPDSDRYERPFAFALRSENYDMIRWVLSLPDLDPDVMIIPEIGDETGLFFAINKQMPLDIIYSMLRLGAWNAYEEIVDDEGFYPLSLAVQQNNYHVIQLLLFYGADPHYDDDEDSGDDPVADFATNDFVKNVIQNWSDENTETLRQIVGDNTDMLIQNPNIWLAACGQIMN
jgi:hypothetical protein